MAQLTKVTIAGFTAGAQVSGTSWMTGYSVVQDGLYFITFELAASVIVNMSIDNTNFYPLNNNQTYSAGWNSVSVALRNGDTLNLNQSSGGPITVNVLRVDF